MLLRLLLVLLLALASKGLFLHHIADECGSFENCPICQQMQATPGEDSALSVGVKEGFDSQESVAFCLAAPHCTHDVVPAAPRAPPATPA